jgi:hypothetical protein
MRLHIMDIPERPAQPLEALFLAELPPTPVNQSAAMSCGFPHPNNKVAERRFEKAIFTDVEL